ATALFGGEFVEFDPRLLQVYGAVLGVLVLALGCGRERPALRPLYPTWWPGLDRTLLGGLVVGQVMLALLHAWPGVAVEWSPQAALADYPWWSPDASGPAAWLCLVVLAGATLATLRQSARSSEGPLQVAALAGLALLAAGAAVLPAQTWATE